MEDREILNLVGARIKVLRKEKGLSQEALGEKGGFHFTYIGQVERGEKNVSLVNLAKIAEALEVNISQLFTYVNKAPEFINKEVIIHEVLCMLRESEENEISMYKNILQEIIKYNAQR
ncbi:MULTISPECIES: helix-turn-helix domain-containing protein [Paenibacillus]|uniref:helix-turn-helix domain-containing protein n=1 Tax=Paenibacillus TaxID=44249 RepID=UPI00064A80D3|nr:helix-turn-helix transcriptional regulator [Paenibacillus sp. VT-400]KLU52977.1 transcriptional regulator [Paenibacillus sp. VT-400]